MLRLLMLVPSLLVFVHGLFVSEVKSMEIVIERERSMEIEKERGRQRDSRRWSRAASAGSVTHTERGKGKQGGDGD